MVPILLEAAYKALGQNKEKEQLSNYGTLIRLVPVLAPSCVLVLFGLLAPLVPTSWLS